MLTTPSNAIPKGIPPLPKTRAAFTRRDVMVYALLLGILFAGWLITVYLHLFIIQEALGEYHRNTEQLIVAAGRGIAFYLESETRLDTPARANDEILAKEAAEKFLAPIPTLPGSQLWVHPHPEGSPLDRAAAPPPVTGSATVYRFVYQPPASPDALMLHYRSVAVDGHEWVLGLTTPAESVVYASAKTERLAWIVFITVIAR